MVSKILCKTKWSNAPGKHNLNNAYPVHSASKFNEMITGSKSVIIVASSLKTSMLCSTMMKKKNWGKRTNILCPYIAKWLLNLEYSLQILFILSPNRYGRNGWYKNEWGSREETGNGYFPAFHKA